LEIARGGTHLCINKRRTRESNSFKTFKSPIMETQNAQLEVLLITGTTFLSGDLCKKDDPRQDRHSPENNNLEEACWNGVLHTMLPEIFGQPAVDNRLYLWEIKATESFLQLDLGEAPALIDSRFSINASSFLSTQGYN
jgi:hypothetical protein